MLTTIPKNVVTEHTEEDAKAIDAACTKIQALSNKPVSGMAVTEYGDGKVKLSIAFWKSRVSASLTWDSFSEFVAWCRGFNFALRVDF